MSLPQNRTPLHVMIAIPVALVVLGALVLSAAAVRENLHFIRAADQVLDLVSRVRTVAEVQRGFAQSAGEDIWADLERAGQVLPSPHHPNPWGGAIRAQSLSNAVMRIEEDLPTRDCRRLALYFLGRQPSELGLLAIEAQSANDADWTVVYPAPPEKAGRKSGGIVESACGKMTYARLALVFRVR